MIYLFMYLYDIYYFLLALVFIISVFLMIHFWLLGSKAIELSEPKSNRNK